MSKDGSQAAPRRPRWWLLATPLLGVVGLMLAGASWQHFASARDERLALDGGDFADIGGRKLHYLCRGVGRPLVMLESGLPRGALDWAPVQSALAATTRVCSYDRGGYGLSAPGPAPRDARQLTAELAALLSEIAPGEPLVLVAHSWGGLLAHRFAAEHRDRVQALVLVDPTSDKVVERMPPAARAEWDGSLTALRVLARLQPLGVTRLFSRTIADRFGEVSRIARYPEAARPGLRALVLHSGFFQTALDELSAWPATLRQATEAGALGALPLRVLIAGRDKEDWERQIGQELLSLSTRSKLEVVPDAGHEIHSERPDCVIATVEETLRELRGSFRDP